MKRFGLVIVFCALSSLGFVVRPLWAVTYAYIPSLADDSVVRVDTSAETFASVAFSEDPCTPYGAAVMPDGSSILITCRDEDTVAELTNANFAGSGTPLFAEVGDQPRGVAIEPNGDYAYVANFGGDSVSVINIGTHTVTETVPVGDGPWGVAAIHDRSEERTKVYVTNYLDGTVTVIVHDGAEINTQTITGVGTGPIGIAGTPDGRYVYVANYTNGLVGTVAVIRTSDDTISDRITVGRGPWGVAVGAQGAYVYVTNSDNLSNSVTLIRTSDNAAVGTHAVGNLPQGVAAPKYGDFAYVINQEGTDPISKIDSATSPATVTGIEQDADHPIDGAFALGAFIGGTPPARPSGLTSALDGDAVTLSWTDSSTDELGFKIERREVGDTIYEEIDEADANATEYTDNSVSDSTSYEYRIRAFNEAADSDYVTTSAEVTTEEDDFSWCFIGTLLNW
jgi:YVTN family beta-propeller protein